MKKDIIKNSIKKKAIKYGGVVLILALVLGGAFYFSNSSIKELEKLKRNVSSLKTQITNKQNTFNEAEKSLNEFLKIVENKLPTEEGYSAGYMRVRTIIPVLKDLKKIYRFKKLDFNLEDLKLSDKVNSKFYTAHENVLNIKFEAASDQLFFSFLNDLENILPGYLQLQRAVILKKEKITKDTINLFIAEQKFSLVSGEVDINWITLKQKK